MSKRKRRTGYSGGLKGKKAQQDDKLPRTVEADTSVVAGKNISGLYIEYIYLYGPATGLLIEV